MNIVKRDAKIVRLLGTGKYTLEQVGQVFNVSRERVRQIFKRDTGKGVCPFQASRSEHRVFMAKKRKNRWLSQVKFVCLGCNKPVKNKDGPHKRKFCQDCRDIQVIEQRDPVIFHICEICGGEFHPYRNIKYATNYKGRFCTQECYLDHLKRNPLYLYKKVIKKYDYEKVAELRKVGLTYREISEIIGCSHCTVWKVLKEKGLTRR